MNQRPMNGMHIFLMNQYMYDDINKGLCLQKPLGKSIIVLV